MKDQEKLHARQLGNKQKIIHATIQLIKTRGIDSVTVRSVCTEAQISTGTFYYYFKNKDELLLSFIMEASFDHFELKTPLSDIAGRVAELYTILLDRYLSFGRDFMQSFYTPTNTALSSYMCEQDGRFFDGTIMARCEKELRDAKDAGYLPTSADPHRLSEDICTIVKGNVFEYCLNTGEFSLQENMERMIRRYLK
ncbi:MAG: TetR/AcrR family transcriptional regulator [Lachnospiraceae bacterium]|nr:TetR/AcrR family transcriptional regulator [Lachnospiraceae bacterium]